MSNLKVDSIGGLSANSHRVRISAGHTLNVTKLAVTGNSALQLPTGTTANRPAAGTKGRIRFNTDTKFVEVDNGSDWKEYATYGTVGGGSGSVDRSFKRFNTLDYDDHWDYVSLLVKGGASTDSKGRHTVSASGSATTVGDYPPFKSSGQCWEVGQDSSSYLTFGNTLDDFRLDVPDWTLEMWVSVRTDGTYPHYFVPGGQSAQGTFKAYWAGGTWRPYLYTGNGNITDNTYTHGWMRDNFNDYKDASKWRFMVYQRCGGMVSQWLDGRLVNHWTSTNNFPGGTPSYCRSGAWSGESQTFRFDELRFTRRARYGHADYIPVQYKTWPTTGSP